MQITRIRIEERRLLRRRPDNSRMTMPHMRHIIIGVKVSTPRVIEQILHRPAHDV
jgi:hypothetical protein